MENSWRQPEKGILKNKNEGGSYNVNNSSSTNISTNRRHHRRSSSSINHKKHHHHRHRSPSSSAATGSHHRSRHKHSKSSRHHHSTHNTMDNNDAGIMKRNDSFSDCSCHLHENEKKLRKHQNHHHNHSRRLSRRGNNIVTSRSNSVNDGSSHLEFCTALNDINGNDDRSLSGSSSLSSHGLEFLSSHSSSSSSSSLSRTLATSSSSSSSSTSSSFTDLNSHCHHHHQLRRHHSHSNPHCHKDHDNNDDVQSLSSSFTSSTTSTCSTALEVNVIKCNNSQQHQQNGLINKDSTDPITTDHNRPKRLDIINNKSNRSNQQLKKNYDYCSENYQTIQCVNNDNNIGTDPINIEREVCLFVLININNWLDSHNIELSTLCTSFQVALIH